MADLVFNKGAFLIASQALDFESVDIRVLLTTSGYIADKEHNFVNQVTNEITSGGVTRKALTGMTITENDTDDRIVFDAGDVDWTAVGDGSQTVARAVVYHHVGVDDAANPLICVVDLTTPRVLNGGDFTLQWSANGIFYLQQ